MGQHIEIKACKTQEEDMMAAWLIAQTESTDHHNANTPSKKGIMKTILQKNILGKWGMLGPKKSLDVKTKQNVDYVNTSHPSMYGSVWTLSGAKMVGKDKIGENGKFLYNYRSKQNLVLAFVAGPNCGATGTRTGTMARTLNKHCSTLALRTVKTRVNGGKIRWVKKMVADPRKMTQAGYDFLRAGTKAAIRAGLVGMIDNGASVALVASVSGGIYAGAYKGSQQFKWPVTPQLVQDILHENFPGSHHKIGQYFKEVWV
jgi:hypothetical protein